MSHKPIEPRLWSETAERVERSANRVVSFSAFGSTPSYGIKASNRGRPSVGRPPKARSHPIRSTLLHLRASDWACGERPKSRDVASTQSKTPSTLKGFELELISREQRRRLKKTSIFAVSRRPKPPDLAYIPTNGRGTLNTVEPNRLRGGVTWHSCRSIRAE